MCKRPVVFEAGKRKRELRQESLAFRRGGEVKVTSLFHHYKHFVLLEKIGFREVRRLKDDRGEGIDTIIFSRSPEINETNYGQHGILI